MKNNLFKKLGRNAEPDDLDEGYNDDYYGTAYRNDYSTQPVRRADRDEDEVTPVARPATPAAVQRPAGRTEAACPEACAEKDGCQVFYACGQQCGTPYCCAPRGRRDCRGQHQQVGPRVFCAAV